MPSMRSPTEYLNMPIALCKGIDTKKSGLLKRQRSPSLAGKALGGVNRHGG